MCFLNVVLCVLAFGGVSEDGSIVDNVVEYDVNSGVTIDQFLPFVDSFLADSVISVEPGIVPEGDYLIDITFTPDGSKVLVSNISSCNVTVMDWANMTVDTTFAVNGYPSGIACSDEYVVVVVLSPRRVYVYNLTDYSLAASFTLGKNPWVVRISDDGNYAYVSCDIDDVCEVINLASLTHTLMIVDFPVWISSASYGTESNRYCIRFSGFEPVCGGDYLAVGDSKGLLFFNTTTGNLDHSITIPGCENVALSGDGNYLVALSVSSPVLLSRIDLSTFSVVSTVEVTGYSVGMTQEIAVNQDGTKAFISTSGNTSTLVRFLTGDFVTFNDTSSPFWIGVSNDHSLAVSGQSTYSIIDFDTETIVAQHQGNSQCMGCVFPVANNTASVDPLSHEGAYFYSFDGSSVDYHGDVLSGSSIEGDGTRRAAIAQDGSVAVVSNTLSDNVSIIDLVNMEVDAILEIGDRVQDVAITSDSRWAVVCGFNSNSVKIIDLDTNSIVADVLTGDRASVVSITPDDVYAYVGNISANTVSVVHLDGASSTEVAEIPCGVIGVVWITCGVTRSLSKNTVSIPSTSVLLTSS